MIVGIACLSVGLVLLVLGWVGERRYEREHRRGGYIR